LHHLCAHHVHDLLQAGGPLRFWDNRLNNHARIVEFGPVFQIRSCLSREWNSGQESDKDCQT